jgi:hypothetical protein
MKIAQQFAAGVTRHRRRRKVPKERVEEEGRKQR